MVCFAANSSCVFYIKYIPNNYSNYNVMLDVLRNWNEVTRVREENVMNRVWCAPRKTEKNNAKPTIENGKKKTALFVYIGTSTAGWGQRERRRSHYSRRKSRKRNKTVITKKKKTKMCLSDCKRWKIRFPRFSAPAFHVPPGHVGSRAFTGRVISGGGKTGGHGANRN